MKFIFLLLCLACAVVDFSAAIALLTSAPALAQNNGVSIGGVGGGSGSSTAISMCQPVQFKCTISWVAGRFSWDGCDFSLSLKNPKMSPINDRSFKIEFEQTGATCGSGSLVPGTTQITPNGSR